LNQLSRLMIMAVSGVSWCWYRQQTSSCLSSGSQIIYISSVKVYGHIMWCSRDRRL